MTDLLAHRSEGGTDPRTARLLPGLGQVPSPNRRMLVARQLGQQLRATGLEPEELAGSVGWPVEIRPLEADTGGLRAMLVPRLTGGFAILVDPRLTPDELAVAAPPERVRAERIAHELAHTAFYMCGTPPWRVLGCSVAEEEFCDAVAAEFVAATPRDGGSSSSSSRDTPRNSDLSSG